MFTTRKPNLRPYILPAITTLISILVLIVVFVPDPRYAPLKLRQLTVIDEVNGDNIFKKGEPLTILDGLCNRSDKDQRVVIVLSVQENTRSFVPRVFYFGFNGQPPTIEEASYSFTLIHNTCLSNADRIVTQIPQNLPASEWRLAVKIDAMGSQSGQVQRIDKVSNVFKVIE